MLTWNDGFECWNPSIASDKLVNIANPVVATASVKGAKVPIFTFAVGGLNGSNHDPRRFAKWRQHLAIHFRLMSVSNSAILAMIVSNAGIASKNICAIAE